MWEQPRYLYAAEFKNGVIKIGITRSPRSRLMGLATRFGPIARQYVGSKHACGYWAERQVYERLAGIGQVFRGREWFVGVRFEIARQLVEQISNRAPVLDSQST